MPSCPERALRRRLAPAALTAALAAAGAWLAAAPGRGYVEGAPPRNTGGFGETTCALCHRGPAPAAADGSLEIVAPAAWSPGGEHVVEVRLRRPGMRRAGFQLTVRVAEGAAAKTQAGELAAEVEGVQVVVAHAVAYAGHTTAGTAVAAAGEAAWRVRWTPPAAGSGAVAFHAAANAANDDDSALGDAVYTAAVVVPEAAPAR